LVVVEKTDSVKKTGKKRWLVGAPETEVIDRVCCHGLG